VHIDRGDNHYPGNRSRQADPANPAIIGVYIVVQSSEGFFPDAAHFGERLELHPLLVSWNSDRGSLFGIPGLFGYPTIAIGRVFLKFGRDAYLKSRFYNTANIIISDQAWNRLLH